MVWVGGGGGVVLFFFFFNDTATTEIYTLSLHDALPILKYVRIQLPRGTCFPVMKFSVTSISQTALSYTKEYGSDRVKVLTLEKNRGKGGAIRMVGLLPCPFSCILVTLALAHCIGSTVFCTFRAFLAPAVSRFSLLMPTAQLHSKI